VHCVSTETKCHLQRDQLAGGRTHHDFNKRN
jgi:hypothetical protein